MVLCPLFTLGVFVHFSICGILSVCILSCGILSTITTVTLLNLSFDPEFGQSTITLNCSPPGRRAQLCVVLSLKDAPNCTDYAIRIDRNRAHKPGVSAREVDECVIDPMFGRTVSTAVRSRSVEFGVDLTTARVSRSSGPDVSRRHL